MIRPPPTSPPFPTPPPSHSHHPPLLRALPPAGDAHRDERAGQRAGPALAVEGVLQRPPPARDRKSTRLNSSHANISYAVFCLKKKKKKYNKSTFNLLNYNES